MDASLRAITKIILGSSTGQNQEAKLLLNTFARWDTVLNFQESGTVEKDTNYTHESVRCNITLDALFSDWGCQACMSTMCKLYTSGI